MRKKTLIRLIFALLCCCPAAALAQVTVTGSNNADGNYTTLTANLGALSKINATSQSNKNIVITITANSTSEDGLYSLNGSSNWTTLKIYPTISGLSLSGNNDSPIINLDGAKNVTIDGRVGGNGSTASLSIKNTSSNSSRAIQFINSAQNNIIRYCIIEGASGSEVGGTIFFAGASSGGGNSNNSITNNTITGRSTNAIYSTGSVSPNRNSTNSLIYNNFKDVWRTDRSSNAINIGVNSTDFIISNNSFYETASFASVVNTYLFSSIYINTLSGNNFTVSGNFIGGNAPACGGSYLELGAANSALTYYPIYMNVGNSTASTIQGNTIKNIKYGSSSATSFSAIHLNAGKVNVTGNTVGATTGNDAIRLFTSANSLSSYGIYINSADEVSVTNNLIGSITTTTNNITSNAHSFYGIYKANAGNIIVSGNVLGSAATAGSIKTSSAATGNSQLLSGIYSAGTGTTTISGNTISNLLNATTEIAYASRVRGIITTDGANTISGNYVHDLTTGGSSNGTNYTNAALIGIAQTSAASGKVQEITGNTIYNLTNNSTAKIEMYGIFSSRPDIETTNISKNFIHSFFIPGATDGSYLHGICNYTGTGTISNNIVFLGNGISKGCYLFGIWNSSNSAINVYHNTVYFNGTVTSGNNSSFTFRDISGEPTARNIRNNLFVNARTNNPGTLTGKHYAIHLAKTSNLTLDYNNYWVYGTGGVLGSNGGDKIILPIVSDQDAHSLNIDPMFINAGTTLPTDYKVKQQLQGDANLLTSIPDDFGRINYRSTPTMGAWEQKNYWKGTTDKYWSKPENWTEGFVPLSGQKISYSTLINYGSVAASDLEVDGDYTVDSLINATDKMLLIPAEKSLTVNKAINTSGNNRITIYSDPVLANGSLIFHNAYDKPVKATVWMYTKASKPATSYKWQFFGIPLRSMSPSPTFDGSYVREMHENDAPRHWEQLTNASQMSSFTGYEITQLLAKTIYFQGELENKDLVNKAITFTEDPKMTYPGQHLIGNPYTAAIDISKIVFGSADPLIIDNTVYLYNTGSYDEWKSFVSGTPSIDNSTFPGQYTAIPIKTTDRGVDVPKQIPSMQAFIVRARQNHPLATISIPYSTALTAVKNSYPLRAPAAGKASMRIDVKGSRFSDRMWIFSEPTCTRGFDNGWDGEKFLGSALAPQLYAMEADGDYQVNSVDDINGTELGFLAGEDSIYTLTFTHENMEMQYPAVYLLDLETNITTDIAQSGTTYSFASRSTASPVKRFKIVTNPDLSTDIQPVDNAQAGLRVFSSQQNIFVQNFNTDKGFLYLYDISGRFIQKLPFTAEGISTFPMSLTAGSYIAKAISGKVEVNKQVIIRTPNP